MIRGIVFLFFLLLAFALNNNLVAAQAEDTDPPTVYLYAPVDGSFRGILEFSARSDDRISDVESVEFGYQASGNALAWLKGTWSANGYWRVSLDSVGLADGFYRLSVRSTDSSGNQRVLLGVAKIVVDNAPPHVVSLISPEAGILKGSLNFSARSDDRISDVESVEFGYSRSNGGVEWFSGRKYERDVWSAVLDTTGLENGVYHLSVRSIDSVGNENFSQSVRKIVINNPGINTSNPEDSNSVKSSVPVNNTSFDNALPAQDVNGKKAGHDTKINDSDVENYHETNSSTPSVYAAESGEDSAAGFNGNVITPFLPSDEQTHLLTMAIIVSLLILCTAIAIVLLIFGGKIPRSVGGSDDADGVREGEFPPPSFSWFR